RITGIGVIKLLRQLIAGDGDFLGVDDDDKIAGVEAGGKDWFVFAAQDGGDFARDPSEALAGCIHHKPLALDVAGFRHIGFVQHAFVLQYQYNTSTRHSPCGGASGGQSARLRTSSSSSNSDTLKSPAPTCLSAPTRLRTMRYKNASATTSKYNQPAL